MSTFDNKENKQIITSLVDYTLTNQTVSLSGTYNYDNFTMVNSTINVGSAGLTINATNISIDSTSKIIANGMGYSRTGPGGGTNGNAGWGSGGGGYGGRGGNGGGGYYVGGGAYGTQNGLDIDKGSGGGDQWSSGNFSFAGGPGGGLIYLNSPTIIIRGQLLANGNPGTGDCWGRQSVGGSGGGSGGGILIYGDSVDIRNATISANGGTGGTGGIYADGGGGGGGGRVKIFYKTLQNSGANITANGAGGVACNVAGQSGNNGAIVYTIPTGSASFTSSISARIWIDGTDTGINTPGTISNITTGNHTYTLKLTGYQDSSSSFSVSYNTNTTVPLVTLTLLPGNVHITSTPSGARIYIDNVDQGVSTPYTITNLSVGNHNLKLTYTNYQDYTALINILTNQTINYDATLTPITGNIMVYSTPTGAEIYIDNIDTTTTTILSGTLLSGINPGLHNVKLILAGRDIWTKNITVTSGITTSVNASLSPYGCTSNIKYSGDDVNLSATPTGGIGPYYIEFRKNGTVIDSSRFGGISNPITVAPENMTVSRIYNLNDADIAGATSGTIDFSVYMLDSCPTGGMTCEDHCTITIGCIAPVCNFKVT